MVKFVTKWIILIGIVSLLLGIIWTSSVLIYLNNKPEEQEVESVLYEKKQLILQDLSNIAQIPGATLTVNENEVLILLSEENEMLQLKLDASNNLVSEEFIEDKFCDTTVERVFFVIGGSIYSLVALMIVILLITFIEEGIKKIYCYVRRNNNEV